MIFAVLTGIDESYSPKKLKDYKNINHSTLIDRHIKYY